MASDRVGVVIDSGVALTTRENDAVAPSDVGAWSSATCTVKLASSGPVGMPEMAPLRERVSPGGSEPPMSLHAYGGVPPAALRLAEYGVPTWPLATAVVVMV